MTAWVALAVSVFAAVLSAFITLRQVRLKSELDLEAQRAQTLAKYREPLAAAAFDLQSRLYNILRLNFFGNWGATRGDDAELTTLFRIAQYFGWTELLRRDIQFLAFPEDEDTRRVATLQFRIAKCFLHDDYDEAAMMIWNDEQRAIGERMIIEEHGMVLCMGYARFRDEVDRIYAGSLARIRAQVHDAAAHKRFRDIQHLLCELVEALDERRMRYTPDNLELA
ncbi:MAG TPA: hypothetical protein VFZ00_31155 [Solirubrobacter sp.]|nr:hypothetical protein [Solirubrobacter sp.]